MRQYIRRFAVGAAMLAAVPALAQLPNGGAPGGMPGMGGGPMGGGAAAGGATMLLAHTGDLQLTDAQVVKLAAIARREGAQRLATRTMMDSVRGVRPLGSRRDSAGPVRNQVSAQLVTAMNRARDQRHADLRDALTVLTPDQQAQAWEMVSARGAGSRGGMRRRMFGGKGGGVIRGRDGQMGEMMPGGMMPGRAPQGPPGGRMQGPPSATTPSAQRVRPPLPAQRPPVEIEPAI